MKGVTVCLMLSGLLLPAFAFGHTLKGRITNDHGEPIPNATIYIQELRQGAAANDDGYYSLELPNGRYTCIVRSLGYVPVTVTADIEKNDVTLDITLKEQIYELEEVAISNKREDPAYNIMRKAIAMAPYYRAQVKSYQAELYLRGSMRIIKMTALVKRMIPKELQGIKAGNTYVEETLSKIRFNAPNRYRQTVVSRTGNLPEREADKNILEMITVSVYDPEALEPYISPLSSDAFAHYRFKYEGSTVENGRTINKIRITPTHAAKQLFKGHIYIVNDFWNVHQVDVSGSFVVGGDFKMKLDFGDVGGNIWMPVSQRVDFSGDILGNKADIRYIASLKYTSVEENKALSKPNVLEGREKLTNRKASQLARVVSKKAEKSKPDALNITGDLIDDYRVQADSVVFRRDTVNWAKIRPVPLQSDELRAYTSQPQPLLHRRPTAPDSARRKSKASLFTWLTGGTVQPTHSSRLRYPGLLPSRAGFNTVDGFYLAQKVSYTNNFGSDTSGMRLRISPEISWAFSRKALMGKLSADFAYSPLRRGFLSLDIGRQTCDFAGEQGVYPLDNSFGSLVLRRNYAKLFNNLYIKLNNTIDIVNGLQLAANIDYERREMLNNHSDFSFFFRQCRQFTPNIPANDLIVAPLVDHNSLSASLTLSYTPRYYYRINRYGQKRMVKSSYPTFSATYKRGIPSLLDSDSDFSMLAVGIFQNIRLGAMRQFRYNLRGGVFLSSKHLYFPDFKHFMTSETITAFPSGQTAFSLPDYYHYSTNRAFIEAHATYTTPYLLLKYLPFIRDRLWNESVSVNYLYTPDGGHYLEAGYSLIVLMRVGVFAGLTNFTEWQAGLRISVPLSLLFPNFN